MERQYSFLAVGVTLIATIPGYGQDGFPYEGIVTVDQGSLHVRSGPSENDYRTGALRRDDRVTVVREEPDGWLAIQPPPDSFSWVSGEFVRETSPTEGEIAGDSVNVRVGTPLSEDLREKVGVTLKRGDRVQILGRKTTGQGPLAKLWYKIVPTKNE